jgi:hypothetical protein
VPSPDNCGSPQFKPDEFMRSIRWLPWLGLVVSIAAGVVVVIKAPNAALLAAVLPGLIAAVIVNTFNVWLVSTRGQAWIRRRRAQ